MTNYLTSTDVTAARPSPVGSMATGLKSGARLRLPPAAGNAPDIPVPLSKTVTAANGRFAICSIYKREQEQRVDENQIPKRFFLFTPY